MLNLITLKRTAIDVTGRDRAIFLHNFCTQDIKSLPVGSLREAFVTEGRGKLLGHIHVLNHGDRLEVLAVPGEAPHLIAHWDRYLIREDVQFADRSDERDFLFVFGQQDANWEPPWGANFPDACGSVRPWPQHDGMWVAAGDFAGPGWLIGHSASSLEMGKTPEEVASPAGPMNAAREQCLSAGAVECGWDELHAHRILHRFPWYGADAGRDNFPQELRRDEQAISFTKGCYLGQETVARIDSRGHVNRWLVRAWMNGVGTPALGTVLDKEGRGVGSLTSVARSDSLGAYVGLATIRRAEAEPGKTLFIGSMTLIVEDSRFP